ncbi:MAG: hypothetical protein GX538_04050 [Gammaproteobacteria bacterium]|nr:hypothetical protein [Gammaproteobacteria bacterium]
MTATRAPDRSWSNRLSPWLWCGAAGLLSAPAIAMWLGAPGVHWTALDFVVMGLLLATACGLYEFGTRLNGGRAWRAGFGLAALTGLLTVWVNLAVGMLGSETDPVNLMFAGVLAVAAIGAVAARFRPQGMSRAMAAAGLAQLAVVAGAAIGGRYQLHELLLTGCFALPWFASAVLFSRAR